MDPEIIIVSGLPRSGTSLMMQMLDSGGVEVVTDNIRTADTDNPRGYYEFEQVKKIKEDAAWLPDARGKAFKMVSQLLYDLPPTERTASSSWSATWTSARLAGEDAGAAKQGAAPREEVERAFTRHLEKIRAWLEQQPNFAVLYVKYSDLVGDPETEARRVSEFLGGLLDVPAMTAAVDPSLYRNRKSGES